VVDALPVSNHPLKDVFETSLASSVALVRGNRTQTAPRGVRV
jgi:hypothetical protein